MNLSTFIAPQAHVARSVNLERDRHSSAGLSQYRLTGKGLEILSRFVAALAGEPVGAWSLTGPYGMGKSSFARFLLALCGPEGDPSTQLAWGILGEKDTHLSRQLHQLMRKHGAWTRGFFRVGVTSSFEPLNRTLIKGLLDSLRAIKTNEPAPWSDLLRSVEAMLQRDRIDTADLAELFRSVPQKWGAPIVLVIDEFGKNLEYMARFPAQGDLFILQMLAEIPGVYLWVCLHQAFEEYTSRLSQRQMQEWAKIQGRFEDISFVEARSEMLGFIGQALVRPNGSKEFARAVRRWAQSYAVEARRLNLTEFQGVDADTFEKFYPIHPLAAVLLPELCVRFAQNDRTLFAFLCSGEPAALPAFLSKATVDTASWTLPTMGPERLYDYFLASTGGSLLGRPESQRWIEIHDLIERSRSADPRHLAVLKTIGLLNLVSGPAGFRASQRMLSFALHRPFEKDSAETPPPAALLREAQERGILIYREYADEYRLWEGSDFDIPKAVRQRRSLLAMQSLEKVLRDTFPLSPLTASRHSFVTGNLRHFERQWIGLDSLTGDGAFHCAQDLDGLILYAFGKEPRPARVPSMTEDGRPILVCYVPCEDEIRDAVLDCAAIQAVLQESPELVRDGVARKEASFRAQAAEQRLHALLETIFVPDNADAQWYVMGRPCVEGLESDRDLSRLLSECCDQVYSDAPWIRNELINRNRLSTAAARARRELMEAMVLRSTEAMLGFEGTGPEVAIYRSMLLQEGLHCEGPEGTWFFRAPEPESRYWKTWNLWDRLLEEAGDRPIAVTELIAPLKRPPFGLKDGPLPILLCLYLMVRSDEIAFYQEGSFVPRIGPEDMELMSKRPELFSLRRFGGERVHGKVLDLYRALLKARIQGEDSHGWRNPTLLSLVGPLVQFVKNLPKYSLYTHRVSREAQQVRQALLMARDPFDLLYTDLPKAVGVPPFRTDADKDVADEDFTIFQERFHRAVTELRDAYGKLIQGVEDILREAFEHPGDISSLRRSLQQRARPLFERCGDPELKPLVKTLADFSGTDQAWVQSVATLVSRRPIDSWRDDDLTNFAVALADRVHRFVNLETMASKLDRRMAQGQDGRIPHLVTLTSPDGASISRILWKDEQRSPSVFHAVESLLEKHAADRLFLETLFVALGERLLSSDFNTEQDASHAQKK